MEGELRWSVEAQVAETRATMEHLVGDISELRKDVRRLDDRVFNLTLASLATLATVLATVIANALS